MGAAATSRRFLFVNSTDIMCERKNARVVNGGLTRVLQHIGDSLEFIEIFWLC